jgi:hypothetical protein
VEKRWFQEKGQIEGDYPTTAPPGREKYPCNFQGRVAAHGVNNNMPDEKPLMGWVL